MSWSIRELSECVKNGGVAMQLDTGSYRTTSTITIKGATIPNRIFGEGILPSAIYYNPDGSILIGKEALERSLLDPKGLVVGFKTMVETSNMFNVSGVGKTPEEIIVDYDEAMVKKTCDKHGIDLKKLVLFLSFPVHWSPETVERIVELLTERGIKTNTMTAFSEPHSAIYAGIKEYPCCIGSNVMVLDIGGGTADILIVCPGETDNFENPHFMKVRSQRGIPKAGIELSKPIVDLLVEKFSQALNMSPETVRKNKVYMNAIAEEADLNKIDLMEGTDISAAALIPNSDGRIVEFEMKAEDYFDIIDRTTLSEIGDTVDDAIASAQQDDVSNLEALGLNAFTGIDYLMCVGGTCKGRHVRDYFANRLGLREDQVIDCDSQTQVCYGLAELAKLVLDNPEIVIPLENEGEDSTIPEGLLNNRLSRGFAIRYRDTDTGESRAGIHLWRDDIVPARNTIRYVVPKHHADTLEGEVYAIYETKHNIKSLPITGLEVLGKLIMPLPEGTKSGDPVEITFTLSTAGTLEVGAVINGKPLDESFTKDGCF
ncbi:MAG: hypothetical protein IKM91_06390 [Candidatus Methanomethylophilaceae archaeon]|nr:hypothetical protein [Candidatus Methanomethylophilaceae archaeon]MBR6871229.1 hypothetical protein [Candidatus Methanomethylophilaceae archaeon]